MEDKLWLIEVLKEITSLMPPPKDKTHSITLRNVPGIADFAVNVWKENTCNAMYLQQSDLRRPPKELAVEIIKMINRVMSCGCDEGR